MIEITGVTKSFGSFPVLKGITASVAKAKSSA